MRSTFMRNAVLALLLASPTALVAQNATSSVVGIVTDASGAILPDTVVTLTNPTTGATYKAKTNSAGSYRFGDVTPGPNYVMTFEHAGFTSVSYKGVYINVANSRTQDAKLTAGANVTVEVNAATEGVTINTDDASIGNNFQVEQLNDLPVYNRNSPVALLTFQPGVTSDGSTTGARVDQNNITLDGLDVNDFGTGNFGSIVGNAPVDSVQEFRGTVAGQPTNSGQGGGGQFQMVTKSGTNHFHGNLNEYHRDNSTTANTWFNNNTTPITRDPKLVQNQFGGAVGGPVKRDKLFFFADVNISRIAQQSSVTRTVPLTDYKAGNLYYLNSSCPDGSRRNNSPASCFGVFTPADVLAHDPGHIGESPALLKLLQLYPNPNDLTVGGDGVNTGTYRFNADASNNLTNYVGRVDYNLTPKIKFFGRGTVARQNSINSTQQFPGLPPAAQFVDRSYAYVAGMDWEISNNKFNHLGYGANVQDWQFPRPANPFGTQQISFSSGTTTLMSTPYSSPVNAQGRHIPIPQVSDDFTWGIGRHNLQMGGFFKWINTSSFTRLDYLSQSIGLGGEIQGLTATEHPANLNAGSTTTVNYDEAFSVLLGRIGSTTGNFNYNNSGAALPLATGSNRAYRYFQTEIYAGDAWKLTPHFTVSYGLNWQIYSVPWEKNGLETVQQTKYDDYMRARIAQSNAGNVAPNGVPFFTYLLGGPVNKGPGYYNMSWKDIAPRLSFAWQPSWDLKTTFNGGAGVVYDRTVVSAVQYQQDQYSYLFTQPVNLQYGNATDPDGSLADTASGNNPRYDHLPTATAPATPKAPFTPYVDSNGLPNGLYNSAFNEMVDPSLKTPYSITATLGMQHEFPNSIIFKVAYAGRFGRRLLAQADSAQLVDFTDPASHETMSTAIANVEKEVRTQATVGGRYRLPAEPYLEDIYGTYLPKGSYINTTSRIATGLASLLKKGDFADTVQGLDGYAIGYNIGMSDQLSENTMYTNKGFSTYHGMLVSLQQNLRHGLKYDVNYTFSHSMDNTSAYANLVAYGGYGFICDSLRPRLCRGNSDFDRSNIITADTIYSLPVGRGRTFGSNMPLWASEIVGGWDIASLFTYQTGQAFGTVSQAFIAGYSNEAPALFSGNTAAIQRKVHKSNGTMYLFANPSAAAAAFSAPTGFNIGSRNNLRGPQYFDWDAGLTKAVALWPEKGINLKFRADAFNVLNHPSFASPGNNTDYDDITQAGSFGVLSATANDRRVLQLILRLEF